MGRNQEAIILKQIIQLARMGKTQTGIAKIIGVNPSVVYKMCKRYGIRIKCNVLKQRINRSKKAQYFLPV